MRRLRIWLLTVVAVVVVLVVVVLIAVPRLVDTPRIQSLIATTTSQSLGRPVKFSGVTISLLPLPSVTLKDLEVAEDPAFGLRHPPRSSARRDGIEPRASSRPSALRPPAMPR